MITPDALRVLKVAAGHVNVSMPRTITTLDLLIALRHDPVDPAWAHHLCAVLDETPIEMLADLVRFGAVTHTRLLQIARRDLRPDHSTLRWLATQVHGESPAEPSRPPPCWRTLLSEALRILDHASITHGGEALYPPWVIGGDVAITYALKHRAPRHLGFNILGLPLRSLAPTRNTVAARLSHHSVYEGNALQIETATGVIAFHAVPLQTNPGFTWVTLGNRQIAIATPEDVVVTALRFRSAELDPLDVIDLAALAERIPDLSVALARETSDALPRVLVEIDRIERLATIASPTELRAACATTKIIIASALCS